MSDWEKFLHGALYIQMEWENVWQGFDFEQKCILGHPTFEPLDGFSNFKKVNQSEF